MTQTLMSREDFLAKVAWEGGVQAALEYGLRAEDCADPELAAEWRALELGETAGDEVGERFTIERDSDLEL